MWVQTERFNQRTELGAEDLTDLGCSRLALQSETLNAFRETTTMTVTVSRTVCQFVHENTEHLERVSLHW
jgi:hypothetical protein